MAANDKISKKEAERTERLRVAWKLFRRDVSITEIARRLKVSIGTAWNFINEQKEDYLAESRQDTEAWMLDAIMAIREIGKVALLEWYESKNNKESVERTISKAGETRTKRKSEGQCGDPKYLTVVLDCIEKEGRLRGAFKNEINVNQQTAVNVTTTMQKEMIQDLAAMDASMLPPSKVYQQYGLADKPTEPPTSHDRNRPAEPGATDADNAG